MCNQPGGIYLFVWVLQLMVFGTRIYIGIRVGFIYNMVHVPILYIPTNKLFGYKDNKKIFLV